MPGPEDSVDEQSDDHSADDPEWGDATGRHLDTGHQDAGGYPGAGPELGATDSPGGFSYPADLPPHTDDRTGYYSAEDDFADGEHFPAGGGHDPDEDRMPLGEDRYRVDDAFADGVTDEYPEFAPRQTDAASP